MPEITELVDSDDDFQDAESEELTAKKDAAETETRAVDSNSDIVDEIIKQQNDLQLNEDVANLASGGDEKEPEAAPEYLAEVIDEEALKEAEKSMTPEEIEANKEKAHNLKLKANDLFKNNESEAAIDIYTDALKSCPFSCNKERAVLYGNRAAAAIKLDSKKQALADCSKALELWPEYVRALVRRAKLYELEDKLDEALADYQRVLELDPGQSEAREAIVRLPPIIEERNERLKTEMLGKLKDLGNMILKPFGLSTSNFQMQQDPNSGGYSFNFKQSPS